MHKNADNPFFSESRRGVLVSRAVPLVSHVLKLYGVADVVEYHQSEVGVSLPKREGKWTVVPVEYKSGKAQDGDYYTLQLCAQAICLEEMFDTDIPVGYIYYGKTRKRVVVSFDEGLREQLQCIVEDMYEMFISQVTPPAVYRNTCEKCSMVDVCLPHVLSKKKTLNNYFDLVGDCDA